MDPFSQAFVGAVVAQNFSKNEDVKKAAVCGALGGMLPDADIFIRSSEDTLLAIEYHRHFTHSLLFIPVGGVIAALLCMLLFAIFRKKINFKSALIFATLGYATHGILDACTSYGTHLSIPFSNFRTSWSIISVVDLLYTIPVIAIVILACRKMHAKYSLAFWVFTAIYFSIGALQNSRVTEQMNILAESRGHKIDHYEVKPTIGNNILWRTVYRTGNSIYVDAIRSTWFGDIKIYEGEKLEAKIFPEDFPNFSENSQQYYDIKRFNLFSNYLIGTSPKFEGVLIDSRYSSEANGIRPMWGLEYYPNDETKRAKFTNFRKGFTSNRFADFKLMLFGN